MGKDSDINESSIVQSRMERGRKSYEGGHSFEDRVAELYRLLHYDVEHGRLFSGRQVDIFLIGRFGDLIVHRAIECKVGPVKAEHIDSFIAKLRLVRREYPSAQGTIISSTSFTDAIKSQAAQEGIQLTLYRDLAAQLLDGHAYAQNLIRYCETSDRYPMSLYIKPLMGYDASSENIPAFQVISEWLRDSEWNQLTLLGDVGTGKSFLSRVVAYQLATSFLEKPLENPLPILIDLRNADRQFSLEGLILTHLAQNGIERVSFEAFQYSLFQGNIVLILDGFDEMATRVSPQITNRNFYELARCVKGRAKVLLTCRTHYFKSKTEEEEVILGSSKDYGSETARDLYWELIARKGFRIVYLRPFTISQIEEYVKLTKPPIAKVALRKIRSTYNLMELSQSPLLLEMVVKSIDKLNDTEINPTTLYKVYTDAWIHRDQWRDVLTPEAKLSFLMALSYTLWQEDAQSIHHTRLIEYVKDELAALIQNPHQLIEIDNEIRTASFLTRDQYGQYGFAHKSYGEFFFARYLSSKLKTGNLDCLNIRRLSPEIIGFLRYLVDLEQITSLLESTLCNDFRPLISENALLCLYGIRRAQIFGHPEIDDTMDIQSLSVPLPQRMKLGSAQLDQVSLEGAIMVESDLTNANLCQAVLAHTNLERSTLQGANLEKANLSKAFLQSAVLRSANLSGATLEGADISEANLSNTNLSDTYLLKISHKNTDFSNVKITRAVLSDELVQIISQNIPPEALQERSIDEDTLLQEMYADILRIALPMSFIADDEPEDIAQEIMIKLIEPTIIEVIKKMDRKQRIAYIKTFAKSIFQKKVKQEVSSSERITRNIDELIDYTFYSIPQGDEITGNEYIDMIPSSEPTVLEKLIAYEGLKEVDSFLATIKRLLSPQSFRIVTARYIEEKPLHEIATNENVSVRTIQISIAKARELIRNNVASFLS